MSTNTERMQPLAEGAVIVVSSVVLFVSNTLGYSSNKRGVQTCVITLEIYECVHIGNL